MSEYDKLIKGHTVKAVALTFLVLRQPLVCNCVVVVFFCLIPRLIHTLLNHEKKKIPLLFQLPYTVPVPEEPWERFTFRHRKLVSLNNFPPE